MNVPVYLQFYIYFQIQSLETSLPNFLLSFYVKETEASDMDQPQLSKLKGRCLRSDRLFSLVVCVCMRDALNKLCAVCAVANPAARDTFIC